MASRRNELSAYTFSRRRTVAAFLQPSGGGNEEDVPKPRRAFMPSLIVGAVAVAGFGAYGMIKPSAPLNWDKANAVIVDKQTTTRYVMLGGQLHPVLNIASARLLLGVDSTVEEVDDSVLNSGSVPHGATLGIPYAPDSLPTAQDAGTPKTWAECDRPASGGQTGTDQKLFVLGGADAAKVTAAAAARTGGRLTIRQALYVQAPSGLYLVDSTGTAHQLVSTGDQSSDSATDPTSQAAQLLATAAFGGNVGLPQAVTKEWLATLRPGDPISLPEAQMEGFGDPSGHSVGDIRFNIGDLFQETDNSGKVLHYVMLKDGIHRVSDFTDRLIVALHADKSPEPKVDPLAAVGANNNPPFTPGKDWPQGLVSQANTGAQDSSGQSVACSVYTGATGQTGAPVQALWTGADYPIDSTSGSAGVYVTPGAGLLYRAVSGTSTDSGAVNLLTDTGLRYPVQMNADGAAPTSAAADGGDDGGEGAGSADAPSAGASGAAQPNTTAALLGYKSVNPLPAVPESWSSLLPAGPSLNSAAATQQQGS
jgi:type VII secretion protein EccB